MNARSPTFVAIDLGSNSFHLIVARLHLLNLRVIDRIRVRVQLAGGLDSDDMLSAEAMQRGWLCLEQFRDRLQSVDTPRVRAVATYTLRTAKNSNLFLEKAESILGYPIEVISGIEEARIIYRGVAHDHHSTVRRLVIDIGGGSSELVVGAGENTYILNSLPMGCVSFRDRFFVNGRIRPAKFQRAVDAASKLLLPVTAEYAAAGWQQAIGTSGTIRAILNMVSGNSIDPTITLPRLKRLRDRMMKFDSISDIRLPFLSENRRSVFPSGLAILFAIVKKLQIDQLYFSPSGLRTGVISELTGPWRIEGIRDLTLSGLVETYRIDTDHARRVSATCLDIFRDVSTAWEIDDAENKQLLIWSAMLHEIGMSINFNRMHKHAYYLLTNHELAGFSQQQQSVLANLIRAHRKRFPGDLIKEEIPAADCKTVIKLARILRLATLVNRRRSELHTPRILVACRDDRMTVHFPGLDFEEHTLLLLNLQQEADYLGDVGYELIYQDRFGDGLPG